MDDPAITKVARITQLRNNWFIQIGKPLANTKMRMKKVAAKEKKEKTKQDKVYEKAQTQVQSNNIKQLALANRQVEVGVIYDILSDP